MASRYVASLWAVCLLCAVAQVQAEDSHFRELINCQEYWAKIDEVPVYEMPEERSRRIASLSAQERLCVIGERGEFYIVDWSKQERINLRPAQEDAEVDVAYVRQVDVRPAPEAAPEDIWSRAQRQLQSVGWGLAPEDIYGPFRPLIDRFHPPTECRAGEDVCKTVEEDLLRREEQATEQSEAAPEP